MLILARPDLAVFTVVAVLRHGAVRSPRALLGLVGVGLPWYAWSGFHLGSLIPDTLLIKMTAHSWGSYTFINGPLLYLRTFPRAFGASMVVPLLGLLVLAQQTALARPATQPDASITRTLALGALAHYGAFSLLGVPPYHWYYGPFIAALTIFACAHAATVPDPSAVRWPTHVLAASCLLSLLVLLSLATQRGGHWSSAPIMTNWALPAEYRLLGETLGAQRPQQLIRSPRELGTLIYFCRCYLLDEFSSRQYANNLIGQMREAASGPRRWWLDFNYRNRDLDDPVLLPALRLVWQPPHANAQGFAISSPWRGAGEIVLARVQP